MGDTRLLEAAIFIAAFAMAFITIFGPAPPGTAHSTSVSHFAAEP